MKIEVYEEYIKYLNFFIHRYGDVIKKNEPQVEAKQDILNKQYMQMIEYAFGFIQKINLFAIQDYQSQLLFIPQLIFYFNDVCECPPPPTLSIDFNVDIEALYKLLKNNTQITYNQNQYFPFLIDISGLSHGYHHLAGFVHRHKQNQFAYYCVSIQVISQELNSKWKRFYHIPIHKLKLIYKECLQKNQTLYAFATDTEFTYYEIQKGFNYYFNCSFSEYEQKLKMLKALELIMFTNAPFKDITIQSGFSTYTTLKRTFAKQQIPLKEIPRLII